MIYTGLVKFIIIYIHKKKEIQVDDLVDGYKVELKEKDDKNVSPFLFVIKRNCPCIYNVT